MDFESIYKAYRQDVFQYITSLTGANSLDAAEELSAETFFRAFTGFHSFRGEASIKTWLFSIARNVFYEYLRKNKRVVPTEDETLALMYVQSGMVQPDAGDLVSLSELVNELLGRRDERSRKVFHMRLEGYSFREIGEKIGISENSARVLEYRDTGISAKGTEKGGLRQ